MIPQPEYFERRRQSLMETYPAMLWMNIPADQRLYLSFFKQFFPQEVVRHSMRGKPDGFTCLTLLLFIDAEPQVIDHEFQMHGTRLRVVGFDPQSNYLICTLVGHDPALENNDWRK